MNEWHSSCRHIQQLEVSIACVGELGQVLGEVSIACVGELVQVLGEVGIACVGELG